LEKEASYIRKETSYKNIPFSLGIDIPEYEDVIDSLFKPHSFLNEAKLSALAISIRLAILTEKRQADSLKFIILDDLLISLDMRNREKVLEVILSSDFVDNYQIILLTHDKMFYNMARHKISLFEQENWVYYEMHEIKENNISKPSINKNKTYLEKAQDFFNENKLEEAANNLRKAAEAFCKRVLAKTDTITEDYSNLRLEGMLNKCTNFAIMNGLDAAAYTELDKHRRFILNASSHDDIETPRFRKELEECLNLFHNYFSKVKVRNILSAGSKLHIELVAPSSPPKTYLFDLTLNENFKLYKEPGKNSVLIKGRLTHGILEDGTLMPSGYRPDTESIQKMYEYNYKKSDKTKNADFWEEVIITETGLPLKSVRFF